MSTLAGKSYSSTGSRDGIGSKARFNYPNGIATDGVNLYVTDRRNNTIRKIVIATREVTTLAGKAGRESYADGTGAEARFWHPEGITTDGSAVYSGRFRQQGHSKNNRRRIHCRAVGDRGVHLRGRQTPSDPASHRIGCRFCCAGDDCWDSRDSEAEAETDNRPESVAIGTAVSVFVHRIW